MAIFIYRTDYPVFAHKATATSEQGTRIVVSSTVGMSSDDHFTW